MSSGKCWPFCLGLNVLNSSQLDDREELECHPSGYICMTGIISLIPCYFFDPLQLTED